jgi:DNA-binding MarR family transcriptional regulator
MANPPDIDTEFVGRLSLSVTRLARVLRQKESGRLPPAAASMYAIIVRDGPISLGDLAAAEGVSPSTVTKIVNKLETLGLIDRLIDPTDRRVHLVRLSARGRRHIEVYRSKRNAWLAKQIAELNATERAGLAVALGVFEKLLVPDGFDPVQRSAASLDSSNPDRTPP